MDPREAIARNRRNWDARTPVHLRSPLYRRQIETLRSGGCTLLPPTDTEIGDVAGRRLLHLQCHLGLDTLSLAQRGAEATGLDFSPAAIAAAEGLSRELGIPARFTVGDAQRADEALPHEQFDLVFASFGVFCWIPDLRRWVASAARLLKPGGVLYFADGHPFVDILAADPDMPFGIALRDSYFRREPACYAPGPSYADDGSGQNMPETVEYAHTLGDFVSAVTAAGLRVDFLHEFPACFFRRYPAMVEGEPGEWDFPPPLKGKLPMVFSLRATRACSG
ncbi:MAG: class I SAM-dependent methyltransferase [Phycisphaerae bacterium]